MGIYINIYRYTKRYTKIYKDIQRYTKIDKDRQKIDKLNIKTPNRLLTRKLKQKPLKYVNACALNIIDVR
jgi:hypothetical protein